jgi:hypothetical protein
VLFFKNEGSGTYRVTQNLVGDGSQLYRSQEKKVPERRTGLRPSEKELLEWHSVTKIPLLVSMSLSGCVITFVK